MAAPTRLEASPDRGAFRRLAEGWPVVPVWAEALGDACTPVGLFPALAGSGPGALLESVERSERWGRYSFVAGDPAAVVTVGHDGAVSVGQVARELPWPDPVPGGAAVEALTALAAALRAPRVPDLPPLAGGLVGFVAYEAASVLDGSPHPGGKPPGCPAMAFLVVDRAAVFDHWRQRLLLIAHVPAAGGYERGVRALEEVADRVRSADPPPLRPVAPSRGGPGPAPGVPDPGFLESVRAAREHILAGDIFQVVLSRCLSVPVPDDGLSVYRRLRVANPSPYMFFLRIPPLELAGSSPEPLVRVEGRRVSTRPIAGTCRRGDHPEEDRRLGERLLADPKERAEHAMLVDLARNDLGRVCRPGSVRVTELMQVERFARVMHLVSTVEGELEEGRAPLEALAATFPAGTLTGAPKRRAMEIIAEREPSPRGPYGGAVGYVSFAGDLDFCITIRTAVVEGGTARVQAGAGVVADSDPAREWRETEEKASALLSAVVGGPR
jgi:anthranilate synthase component 1